MKSKSPFGDPPCPFKTSRKGERNWRQAVQLADQFDRRAATLLRDPEASPVLKAFGNILRDAAASIQKGAVLENFLEWFDNLNDSRFESVLAALLSECNREGLGSPKHDAVADFLSKCFSDPGGKLDESTVRQRAKRLKSHMKRGEPMREFLQMFFLSYGTPETGYVGTPPSERKPLQGPPSAKFEGVLKPTRKESKSPRRK